jgi:hypothetical protein
VNVQMVPGTDTLQQFTIMALPDKCDNRHGRRPVRAGFAGMPRDPSQE